MNTFLQILNTASLALLCAGAVAQNPDSKRVNHWYFGEGAGLDFTNGAPVADTTGAMHVWKGSTTMSDTAGNLLFYSDGRHVWNAQHDTMPNGDIWGIPPTVFPMDCAIAVPKPGDDNIYYIFTSDGTKLNQQNGLQYHIIDMSLDGGLGNVVQKNIPLYNPVSEQLCAVRHGNNCDYWLITHEKHTENYLAFHISGLGVDPTPVVSPSGISYAPFTCSTCEYTGGIMLKASPQGDKLAALIHWRWQNTGRDDEIQLSGFDNLTGTIVNSFLVELDTTWGSFGFSPDGSILYAEYGGFYIAIMEQIDLTSFDSLSVVQSRTLIRQSFTKSFATDLTVANDGKIYGTNEWGWALNKDSIPVIHQPNVWGTGCMLDEWGFGLNGRLPRALMPLMVDDFSAPVAPPYCYTGIAEQEAYRTVQMWLQDNVLYISTSIITPQEYALKIINSTGALCASSAVVLSVGNTLRYDMAHLQPALYLLELTAPNHRRYTQSFIKSQ